MSERCDVVVVGSGAGGGVVAGELGRRGRRVVLLECGPHQTAHDFTRFELRATRDLWWPVRFASTGPRSAPIVMVAGRCVGGGTTINTKVALRATDEDMAKWHAATGLLGEGGRPFAAADLEPWYELVEQRLGVRERADWPPSVRTVERGFRALGTELEPVRAYTDEHCMRCGSCLQGCATNAGKSTLTTWIQPGWVRGELDLRAGATVRAVRIEERDGGLRATGVDYEGPDGELRRLDAGAVVVAAGTLNTPLLLGRSGLGELAAGSPSAALVGRTFGAHTARMVHGLFDEPQDCHTVYPITARCHAFQRDADGGFVVEATTIMDPIALASNLVGEDGLPLWGDRLVRAMRAYRRWAGLFMMTNDANNGTVGVDEDGRETFEKPIPPEDQERLDRAHAFCVDVLRAAGAREVVSTGCITSHVQGSCRMGSDPARSVVDAHGESHDVRGLFLGDGSVIPRVLSVNPSLTIMALAARLADHLDRDPAGYLSRGAVAVA
jgi:choline dehydrogenase-like flavoprotein